LRTRFVNQVVVSDDAALDTPDACSLERLDPTREIVTGASANRRIACADHEQVSAKNAVDDRTGGTQGSCVSVVPAHRICRSGDRHEFGHRRWDEQRARVQRKEPLASIERLHGNAPRRAADAGHSRGAQDVLLKLCDGIR
jgi:hypothetical protein